MDLRTWMRLLQAVENIPKNVCIKISSVLLIRYAENKLNFTNVTGIIDSYFYINRCRITLQMTK